MMKLIVITTETFFEGEAVALNRLFEAGLDTLHLRKPFALRSDMEHILRQVDCVYHPRVVLHDHYELTEWFDLKGIHLNRRNPVLPAFLCGKKSLSVSRSCHSLEDVVASDSCDYVFLSPVFDSISKTGYTRGFTPEQLQRAKADGMINDRVVALGGIERERIAAIRPYGFGGVAVLGALWREFAKQEDMADLLKRFDELNMECKKI